jgi:EKC/KEOPS complex subunit CGI121/TPRKB
MYLTIKIVSHQHLMTAIQTTILDSLTPSGDVKTRSHNLHSEILLALSPNYNITDSIRRHGLSDSTKELVVVRIEQGLEEHDAKVQRQKAVWEAIEAVVQGELVAVAELDKGDKVDWSRVDKVCMTSLFGKVRRRIRLDVHALIGRCTSWQR